jgi:hypothetical protein
MSLPIRRTQAAPWLKDGLWRKAQAAPSLDLRFADSKSLVDSVSGQSLVTISRASSATYTDSTGDRQTATTNAPRFDHNPTTGESLGLLVEEQRTNLLLRSEEFDTSWTRFGTTTLTTNTVTAPSGTLTADNIVFASGSAGIYQAVTALASTAYTFSIWIKSSSSTQVKIVINTNLFDPVIQTVTVTSAWQRFSISKTTSAGTNTVSAQVQDNGSGGTQFDLSDAQLEAGSFPTSYIPTTTAAATRAADVATIIDSAIANGIRTLYLEFRSPASGTRGVASLNNNTSGERAEVATSGTDPILTVVAGGTTQASIDGGTVTANVRTRVAVRVNANNFSISVNGGIPVVNTSGTVPTVDRLMLGRTQAGDYLNGALARVVGWPALLPNTALQRITQ